VTKPFVAVLMGSDSHLAVMEAAIKKLRSIGIPVEAKVSSAHLAGAVAANTLKPVIGVPIDTSMQGLDALLSTVQIPGGIPVATVVIGKAGAANAAYLAARVLSLDDPQLAARLAQDRAASAEAVVAKNQALQERLQQL